MSVESCPQQTVDQIAQTVCDLIFSINEVLNGCKLHCD